MVDPYSLHHLRLLVWTPSGDYMYLMLYAPLALLQAVPPIVETTPATLPWYAQVLLAFVATIPLLVTAWLQNRKLNSIHFLTNASHDAQIAVSKLLEEYGSTLRSQLEAASMTPVVNAPSTIPTAPLSPNVLPPPAQD